MSDALIRAQGVALAVLESLLISKGVLEPGELSAGLDDLAESTTKTDAEAAELLEDWSAMLTQVEAAGATKQ